MITNQELLDIRTHLVNDKFDSILINKRNPVTYRLFAQINGVRVCLHKMLEGTTKPHAHKYDVRVLILDGEYRHEIYNKNYESVYSEKVVKGSAYHIVNPNTLHSVLSLIHI